MPTPHSGRSASFRLRFRFVSCVRAGEAKLRGRVGGVILNAGPCGRKFSGSFAALFEVFLSLYVWFLSVLAYFFIPQCVQVIVFCVGFKGLGK